MPLGSYRHGVDIIFHYGGCSSVALDCANRKLSVAFLAKPQADFWAYRFTALYDSRCSGRYGVSVLRIK